jgi:hypothetical protein
MDGDNRDGTFVSIPSLMTEEQRAEIRKRWTEVYGAKPTPGLMPVVVLAGAWEHKEWIEDAGLLRAVDHGAVSEHDCD